MAFAPAPQLKLQSRLPLFASSALKLPLPSPKKNKLPAVASPPPISGCSVSCFHATLPVSTFTAATRPHCFSLGMTLNAPPSQSFEPPGYLAASTWYVIGWWRLSAMASRVFGSNDIGDHSTPPFAPGSMRAPSAVGSTHIFSCGIIASENRIRLQFERSWTYTWPVLPPWMTPGIVLPALSFTSTRIGELTASRSQTSWATYWKWHL